MCFMPRMSGPEILWSKTSFFAMNRMTRRCLIAGKPAYVKSMYDKWFIMTTAPPVRGRFSEPTRVNLSPCAAKRLRAMARTGG